MRPRLDKLWEFIENYLEIDYGYLPKLEMNDTDDSNVDNYIEEIKSDFRKMKKIGVVTEDESLQILKKLDTI